MPKYEIDLETRAYVWATLAVEAKDEREARKLGAAKMREGGYYWRLDRVDDNAACKLVDVREIRPVRPPRKSRTRKPGTIFTPKPPKNFCAKCGLNEILHPSKSLGEQTACDRFTPPEWLKRAPA